MRIALFTSGGAMGKEAVNTLSTEHELILVVQPGRRSVRSALRPLAVWVGLRRKSPVDELGEILRKRGIRHVLASTRTDPRVSQALAAARPDIICIAAYPWVLERATYSMSRFGAVNLHPSLLPRHRGRVPLFWVYHRDDRTTGVTVHSVSEQADAGPILLQESFDVPRGWPVDEMHRRCAERGAMLLAEACDQINRQSAVSVPQDESRMTLAPKVAPGTQMIDFASWPVERVWHFLVGLARHYREPLRDRRNRLVTYSRVAGYETGVALGVAAGVVVDAPDGWLLQCGDGVVELRRN
jgi:methionyl-tRNA formyltransferase